MIGGGDFANDRITPDCVQSTQSGEVLIIGDPYSTQAAGTNLRLSDDCAAAVQGQAIGRMV